jgi:hypothetical protein
LENNNLIINGLWIGKTLSAIELLCIRSFLYFGHEFHLWVYDKIETPLPEKVVLEDASLMIPKERVFFYTNKNQFGHGKGSYAGFSDIFRYKLLYEKGGWWVDMDVCCLKPFDFSEDYVFRTHHDFPAVGNIIKCPQGSLLMKACFEEALSVVNSANKDWNKPIEILNNNIQKFGLGNHIHILSNTDSWLVVRKLINSIQNLPASWYAIHWINEEWRANGINKKALKENSTLGFLLKKFELYEKPEWVQLLVNNYKLSWLGFFFKKAPVYFYNYIRNFVLFHSKKLTGKKQE